MRLLGNKQLVFIQYLLVILLLSGCFPVEKRASVSIEEKNSSEAPSVVNDYIELQLTDRIQINGKVDFDLNQTFYSTQARYYQFTQDDLALIDSELVVNGNVYREDMNGFYYEHYSDIESQGTIFPSSLDYSKNIPGEWNFLVSALIMESNIYNLSSFEAPSRDIENLTVSNAIQQADEILESLAIETIGKPQVITLDDKLLSEINDLDLNVKTEGELFNTDFQGQMLIYQLAMNGVPLGENEFQIKNSESFFHNGGKLVFIFTEEEVVWVSLKNIYDKEIQQIEISEKISLEDLKLLIIEEYDSILGIESLVIEDIRIALLPSIQDIDNFIFEINPYFQVKVKVEQTKDGEEYISSFFDYYSLNNGARYD